MNRVAPILLLAAALPGSALGVEWGLPWFHTRPKPVLLDEQSPQQVAQKNVKRADYRVYSDQTVRPAWAETNSSRSPLSHSSSHGKSGGTAQVFTRPAR